MKKYSTWEVIKMMSENKKLRFKYDIGSETGEIAIVRGDIRIIKCDNAHIDGPLVMHIGFMNITWELVQQPVTAKEAADAFISGKNVRCEYPNYCNHSEIITEIFKQHKEQHITLYMISEGTWYIEEE